MASLYDAVGHGMWAYSNAAFRVDVLDRERFRPEPGTLVAVTHRRETDVPVICPPLYFAMGGRRNTTGRMHFAARDDMFLPGFFAGFPPDLPPAARRLLYRVGVARWLPRVNVFPIRSASVARVGEVLAAAPDRPLAELVPAGTAAAFAERAAGTGRGAPAKAADALRGEYADLLWQPLTPEETPGLDEFWSGRAARAAGDFRTLVEIVRAGHVLIVFPEGRPSPDGEIGPIRPGIGALVRRGKPAVVRPLALAYDPLVRGRTRVHLALGEPAHLPGDDVEGTLLALLRVTMPLTCGQVVAARLEAGADADVVALERDLGDAVAVAREEGRPVEPDLLTAEGRRRRLTDALAVAPRRAAHLPFLAREHASARAVAASA
ncbi:MAG TPA: 1-acyl-sn-glycerol-3-phosphate acyltransferase [Gaiellaceae bacterium]|nr:1-acyl-sn-glycerol-3-phosphate acyltransferase [Gaiellaceae bacterium]